MPDFHRSKNSKCSSTFELLVVGVDCVSEKGKSHFRHGEWAKLALQRLAHLSRRGEEVSYAEAMEDWLQNRIDAVNLTDRLDERQIVPVPSHGTLRAAYRALQTSFARRSRSAE